jgi:hypothetical protein
MMGRDPKRRLPFTSRACLQRPGLDVLSFFSQTGGALLGMMLCGHCPIKAAAH